LHTFRISVIPVFLILLTLLSRADGSRPADEYKFDSPSVMFLGTNRANTVHPQSRPVRYNDLSPQAASAILSASDHDLDSPDLMSYGANAEKEGLAISKEGQRVRRSGEKLSITPASGPAITFTNWSDAGDSRREGDGAKYFYTGRFGRFAYHRVEDHLEHDSPGSYLINPANGKMAYVHQGDDIAALSPDNVHLLVFNPLNLQKDRALTVASLGADGPAIELRCVFNKDNGYEMGMSFKGWRNSDSFEVVFKSSKPSFEPIPIHVEYVRGGWVIAVPNRFRLEAELGFECGH